MLCALIMKPIFSFDRVNNNERERHSEREERRGEERSRSKFRSVQKLKSTQKKIEKSIDPAGTGNRRPETGIPFWTPAAATVRLRGTHYFRLSAFIERRVELQAHCRSA
jgi:hypothetical protein